MDVRARPKTATLLLLLLLWLLYALPVQIAPTHFIHDDSYFYVQIASNLVSGHGSTFHEITPTNGYHPLWMAFCVAAQAASGGDKLLALHVVALIQATLALATVLCFRRIVASLGLRHWSLGAVLLAGYLLSSANYGSEAHLNAFLLSLGVMLLLSASVDDRGGWAVAGLALALAVLARLDNVFVVGALIVIFTVFSRPSRFHASWRRMASAVAPSVVLVGGYVLLNLLAFGHPTPISGAIKSTFPEISGSLGNLSRLGKVVSCLGIASVFVAVVYRGPRPLRLVLAGLGAGVAAHATYIVLFTDHYTFWGWYYVSGVLNAALLAVVGADLVTRAARSMGLARAAHAVMVASAVALGLLSLGYGWAKALNPSKVGPIELPMKLAACRWPEQLGAWMKQNLPDDSGVLVYDWPGALAVHSDLRILPADGLINDYAYNDSLPSMGVESFLCSARVGYYFGRRTSAPGPVGPQRELELVRLGDGWQELEIRTPLTKRSGGTFRVRDADLVTTLGDVVDCPDEAPDAAIWRLALDCSHRPGDSAPSPDLRP